MENKIKEIRKEEGMTQYTLAKMSRLSVGYICHLERGTRGNPSYRTMYKISFALKRKVKEVFNVG